ncbi:MAG: hydrogenase maturation protease, partial [Myxococcota bacterium]
MLTIVGCGKAENSDDGVGLEVVRRIRERLAQTERSDIRVLDAVGDPAELMKCAMGSDQLILVDASRSSPGTRVTVPADAPDRDA